MFCEGDSRRGLVEGLLLSLFCCMSASFTFLTYGTSIIEKSGTHLSPQISMISLAILQIVGTFLTAKVVDSRGRKFLLIISMVGCTIGHAVMAGYLCLYENGFDTSAYHWTPVICMNFIILIASIGIVPLLLICMVESFPVKTRSFGLAFGNVATNGISFVIIKTFPILAETIGLQICLWIFSVTCAISVIYIVIFIHETKGKELNIFK